jgi:hypothetical protein
VSLVVIGEDQGRHMTGFDCLRDVLRVLGVAGP